MRKAVNALWHLRRGQDYEAGKLFDLRRLTLTPPAQATLITESDAGEAEGAVPADARRCDDDGARAR